MPKEQIRKRGKRKPKNAGEEGEFPVVAATTPAEPTITHELPPHLDEQPQAGPSGIHPARAALLAGRRPAPADIPAPEPVEDEQVLAWSRNLQDAEYPFGVLDPDLKAYFRNVDDQIRDWEGVASTGEEREGESRSSSMGVEGPHRADNRPTNVLKLGSVRASRTGARRVDRSRHRSRARTAHAIARRLGSEGHWRCLW